MRAIKHIHGDKAPHWVGDGFYVKTLINHLENDPNFNYSHTDPFLLLDYGEPTTFAPNPSYQVQPHGVGQHPHKGFEAVTIAYSVKSVTWTQRVVMVLSSKVMCNG